MINSLELNFATVINSSSTLIIEILQFKVPFFEFLILEVGKLINFAIILFHMITQNSVMGKVFVVDNSEEKWANRNICKCHFFTNDAVSGDFLLRDYGSNPLQKWIPFPLTKLLHSLHTIIKLRLICIHKFHGVLQITCELQHCINLVGFFGFFFTFVKEIGLILNWLINLSKIPNNWLRTPSNNISSAIHNLMTLSKFQMLLSFLVVSQNLIHLVVESENVQE